MRSMSHRYVQRHGYGNTMFRLLNGYELHSHGNHHAATMPSRLLLCGYCPADHMSCWILLSRRFVFPVSMPCWRVLRLNRTISPLTMSCKLLLPRHQPEGRMPRRIRMCTGINKPNAIMPFRSSICRDVLLQLRARHLRRQQRVSNL